MPRLPATRALHHRPGRASPDRPPLPRPAGRRPPRRRRPGLAGRIPAVAAPRPTGPRPARPPPPPPRPPPPHHHKQHPAPPPRRRPQPPPPGQPGPHPHQRRQLGARIAPRATPGLHQNNPPRFSVGFQAALRASLRDGFASPDPVPTRKVGRLGRRGRTRTTGGWF